MNCPRTILHVGPGNMFGGIERTLVTLAGAKVEETGLRHAFAVTHSGWFENSLRERGAEVHLLPSPRVRDPWKRWTSRRQLAQVLDAVKPDAVMVHSNWTLCQYGSMLGGRAPLLFWLHDFVSRRRLMDRWAARSRPDLILCNSLACLKCLEGEGLFKTVPKQVLHPAVGLPEITCENRGAERKRIREAFGVKDGERVFIQIGRIAPSKGHRLMLEALGRAGGRLPPWRYWIVGGAQTAEERAWMGKLKIQAAQEGLQARTHFWGHREDVFTLLGAADVCVHPCLEQETFGLVLVEALATGMKVVAADHGGAREILGDGSGMLVQPGDCAAWMQAVEGAAAASRGEAKRAQDRARELTDLAGVSGRLVAILGTFT